jgi:cyanocobalamin reductase (cyanide-eliminating) / alkylcobalamin dealkylase
VGWREVTRSVASDLAAGGLDLVAPSSEDGRLALVVGNSRALWPRFKAWLAADRTRIELAHPLETYVEAVVGPVVVGSIRYAHDGPPWLPIQRLAERAGLAWLAPSNLAIHPVYGPWISLRAYVVVDVAGPEVAPPPAPTCAGCPTGCMPAFEKARRTLDPEDAGSSARASWQDWLAVRDACPIGREHRFEEDHIRYGYTKDRSVFSSTRPCSTSDYDNLGMDADTAPE